MKKGTYLCRYCGKELVSFNCDCEGSRNSDVWKAKKRNIKHKKYKKNIGGNEKKKK